MIYSTFQGEVRLETQQVIVKADIEGGVKPQFDIDRGKPLPLLAILPASHHSPIAELADARPAEARDRARVVLRERQDAGCRRQCRVAVLLRGHARHEDLPAGAQGVQFFPLLFFLSGLVV